MLNNDPMVWRRRGLYFQYQNLHMELACSLVTGAFFFPHVLLKDLIFFLSGINIFVLIVLLFLMMNMLLTAVLEFDTDEVLTFTAITFFFL